MKNLGFVAILMLSFLPFAECSTCTTIVTTSVDSAVDGESSTIVLSDGTIWMVVEEQKFDPDIWQSGNHICFWRSRWSPQTVYQIINMDTVARVKVIYLGRTE